jgi:hypothetical protein
MSLPSRTFQSSSSIASTSSRISRQVKTCLVLKLDIEFPVVCVIRENDAFDDFAMNVLNKSL